MISSRRELPNYWIDPRIEFVAVDFLEPQEITVEKLRHVCSDVTHAYFTSYVHDDDFRKLRDKNVPLFKNFIDVIDTVCPKLERVCLQTGGKVRRPDLSVWTHAEVFRSIFSIMAPTLALSRSRSQRTSLDMTMGE